MISRPHTQIGLLPFWQYTAKGLIWRVAPDAAGHLIGEERDLDGRKAEFFCIDTATGTVAWEHLFVDDPWWVGIESVHNGIVFFHGFATPALPGHRGITAVSVATGKRLWSRADLRFLNVRGNVLVALEEKKYPGDLLELDKATGRELHRTPDAMDEGLRIADGAPVLQSGVSYPHLLGGDEPEDVRGIVKKHTRGMDVDGGVHVLSHPCGLVFQSRSMLRVVDGAGEKVLFEDLVGEEITNGSARSFFPSFFIDGNILLYIKNRMVLCAVHLSP